MTAVDASVVGGGAYDACDACGAARAECECETLEGDLARQARALAGAGVRAARDGMLHRACALLERAAMLDTLGAAEWNALGLCALATGETGAAVRAWRQASAIEPDGPAALWLESAERGPVRRALDAYESAAWAARASRLDEARAAIESVRATLPDFVPAARLAGLVQAALGDTAGARETWRAAARVCRDDADLLGLLAGSAELHAPSPVVAEAVGPTAAAVAVSEQRGRRADPTDLALDEEELARVLDTSGLDPEALGELATVEQRVRAGWRRIRSTTASYAGVAQPPAMWGHRLASTRVRVVAGAGVVVLAALLTFARSGHRTATTAAGQIGRDSGAADSTGARRAAAPPTPEALAARALGAALGGNRDSMARAIAAVGDARRSWSPTVQQRAQQIQSEVGRERYRAGRAAMAARRWDAAAAELGLAAAYGAFTPWHDSAYYYLAQAEAQRGDSAAARRTALGLVARYPSSELSRDALVQRLTRAAPAAAGAKAP